MQSTITLLDGGTGRELRRMGAPFRQPEWSALALIEGPNYVKRVHEAFIRAGADVITTNSYAIVPFHVGAERFARDGRRLAALAGRLAREAADAGRGRVLVAGSLPPACGSYRADWFDPRVAGPILELLTESLRPHVDLWLAETLSSTEEAHLVHEFVRNDGIPLWLSFTLRDDAASAGHVPLLRSGQSAVDAVALAAQLGAQAVAFNCSQPEVMGNAVTAARHWLGENPHRLRIGVYANAFPPVRESAEANADLLDIRADLTPAGYLTWVRDWIDRGADIVGGCCGIGPEHIETLRAAIEV